MKAKIKIMKTRPAVSEEEIRSFIDFDALLARNDARVEQRRTFRKARNWCIGIACILAIPALIFLLRSSSTGPHTSASSSPPASSSPSASSVTGIDSASSVTGIDSASSVTESSASSVTETSRSSRNERTASGTEADAERVITRPDKAKSQVTAPTHAREPVYVQAEPVEGYPALYEYFDNHLVYPPDAIKDSLEATVNVVFVIDEAGNAIDIVVENSPGRLFDDEAIRVIENMPVWNPATYNGKPVRSKISLPMTFGIHKTRNP
jgi:TonB family protein